MQNMFCRIPPFYKSLLKTCKWIFLNLKPVRISKIHILNKTMTGTESLKRHLAATDDCRQLPQRLSSWHWSQICYPMTLWRGFVPKNEKTYKTWSFLEINKFINSFFSHELLYFALLLLLFFIEMIYLY